MTVRDHIIQLLRGPAAGRIRFTFPAGGGTMRLGRRNFLGVAHAIECGTVQVVVTTAVDADAGATYDPTNSGRRHGRISLRPSYIGRGIEADIIHECTHAVFDLERRTLTALDNETAAYVVGGLYARMTGLPNSRYDSPIRAVARATVTAMLQAYQRGDAAVPDVDAPTWHAIRATIPVRPAYVGQPAGTGGSYVQDG